MKLRKTTIEEFKCIYYATDKDKYLNPVVWLRKTKNIYHMCGSLFFIIEYLPKNFFKKGFKTKKMALKYLKKLTIIYSKMDVKEKRKLYLIDSHKKEFGCKTIKQRNETFNFISKYKKEKIK